MLFIADFGADKAGIATVGYRLVDVDGGDAVARTTTGVVEIGGGQYQADVSIAVGTVAIQWDTGETIPVYASEAVTERPTTHTETILYCKIGATTQHKIDLGVFGSAVSGTPSAQLYIDNTATGAAYNLTGPTGTEYPLPITIADNATLKGKTIRVTVTATVDDRVCHYHVNSSAAVTNASTTLSTAVTSDVLSGLVASGTVIGNTDTDDNFPIIYLIRGDAYDGTAHASKAFTVSKDFTSGGWSGTLTIRHRTTGASLSSVSVSVTSANTITASFATSDTAFTALTQDEEFGSHPFDIEMSDGTSDITYGGAAVIRKDQTTG